MPAFGTDHPSCPVISTVMMNNVDLYQTATDIVPIDILKQTIYTFDIKVTAMHGRAFKIFGPYSLSVGCTNKSFTLVDDPAAFEVFHINPGNPEKLIYQVFPPKIITTLSCQIE